MHSGKIPVHGEGRRKRIKYSSHFVNSQGYCEKKCAMMPVCLYGGGWSNLPEIPIYLSFVN